MVSPQTAMAWGNEGHQVTALIAFKLLTPKAQKHVLEILGGVPITTAATWPDDLKRAGEGCVIPGAPGCNPNYRPETSQWHFVDMPMTEDRFDPKGKYCESSRYGDCIIPAIEEFRVILAKSKGSGDEQKRKRHDALSFVIHLLGDLHQPLHCADNGDGGGNAAYVTWEGEPKYTWADVWNLHSVWDSYLIDLNIAALPENKRTVTDYAALIVAQLDARERKFAQLKVDALENGRPETVISWAEASHTIAKTSTYVLPSERVKKSTRGFKAPGGKDIVMLNSKYFENNRPKVQDQLKLGGIRLARILNELYDKD
jgi:hypothetical protein